MMSTMNNACARKSHIDPSPRDRDAGERTIANVSGGGPFMIYDSSEAPEVIVAALELRLNDLKKLRGYLLGFRA
jgi:hypothetical protein